MNSNIEEILRGNKTFGYTELGPLVSNLWGVAFTIGAVAAFLYTVLGAVNWITGGGDKGKVEEAKNRITQGMLGLAILAVTWAVALLVQRFLGLNILRGGSGGGGGPYPCEASQKNLTQCRNQDCQFYKCDGSTWIPQGTYEPICQSDPSKGCYGVNQGNF